jgi:hypothetical protein
MFGDNAFTNIADAKFLYVLVVADTSEQLRTYRAIATV